MYHSSLKIRKKRGTSLEVWDWCSRAAPCGACSPLASRMYTWNRGSALTERSGSPRGSLAQCQVAADRPRDPPQHAPLQGLALCGDPSRPLRETRTGRTLITEGSPRGAGSLGHGDLPKEPDGLGASAPMRTRGSRSTGAAAIWRKEGPSLHPRLRLDAGGIQARRGLTDVAFWTAASRTRFRSGSLRS